MILFITATNPLLAQELVIDRPDFTESAVVVPFKSVQLESGVELVNDRDINILSVPNALFRIGMHPNIEFRMGVLGWSRVKTSQVNTYFNDILLETKVQVSPKERAWQLRR